MKCFYEIFKVYDKVLNSIALGLLNILLKINLIWKI